MSSLRQKFFSFRQKCERGLFYMRKQNIKQPTGAELIKSLEKVEGRELKYQDLCKALNLTPKGGCSKITQRK